MSTKKPIEGELVLSGEEAMLPVIQDPYINLITIAVEKDYEITKLERLLALQTQWEDRQARKEYLAALSRFQTSVPVIAKNGFADFGPGKASYSYGKLEDVVDGIKLHLSENGLSYSWRTAVENGVITVTCILAHSGGHAESTTFSSV